MKQLIDNLNSFDMELLRAIFKLTENSTDSYATTKELINYIKVYSNLSQKEYHRTYFHQRLQTLSDLGILDLVKSTHRLIRIKPNKKDAINQFISWYNQLNLKIIGGNK